MRRYLLSIIILISLVVTPSGLTFAQQGFNKTYSFSPFPGLTVFSVIRSILPDTNQIFVLGLNNKDSFPDNAFSGLNTFLGSFDYNGNLLWEKKMAFANPAFNANEPNLFHLLAKLSPDKYVFGGHGYDFLSLPPSAMSRPFLYFFKPNGDSIRFVSPPYDSSTKVFQLYAMMADKQNNILATGPYWNNFNADTAGIWLDKFNSSGDFLWRKIILDTPYYNTGSLSYKIINGNKGNSYLIGGFAADPDTAHLTYYCVWNTDTAGNVLWRRNLPKTPDWVSNEFYGDDMFFDIINANNGNGYYFIAAASRPVQYPGDPPSFTTAYYCGKLDEDGHVVWSNIYQRDSLYYERCTGLMQKSNGDLVFLGQSGTATGDQNTTGAAMFCTDSLGHVKWMKVKRKYDCSQPIGHIMYSIKPTPDNRIAMGGFIGQLNPQPGCYDTVDAIAWLVLTDSLGRTNDDDTITYPLQTTIIEDHTAISTVPDKDRPQVSIYPNPATDLVTIELRNFKGDPSKVKASLYDYTGRVLSQQSLYNSKAVIDLAHYSPGIYYIRLLYKDKDIGGGKVVKQ